MLDTGNTIRTGAAINAAYCQKIGLAWRRYKQKEPVGTAKKSFQLQVLGETEPLNHSRSTYLGCLEHQESIWSRHRSLKTCRKN